MFHIGNTMTAQELCVKGRWLFGPGWRTHLAAIMGAGYSTVKAWAYGSYPVPGPAAFSINLMCNLMTLATGRVVPTGSATTTKRSRQGVTNPND